MGIFESFYCLILYFKKKSLASRREMNRTQHCHLWIPDPVENPEIMIIPWGMCSWRESHLRISVSLSSCITNMVLDFSSFFLFIQVHSLVWHFIFQTFLVNVKMIWKISVIMQLHKESYKSACFGINTNLSGVESQAGSLLFLVLALNFSGVSKVRCSQDIVLTHDRGRGFSHCVNISSLLLSRKRKQNFIIINLKPSHLSIAIPSQNLFKWFPFMRKRQTTNLEYIVLHLTLESMVIS